MNLSDIILICFEGMINTYTYRYIHAHIHIYINHEFIIHYPDLCRGSHTNTHTHIYVYIIYICMYAYMYVCYLRCMHMACVYRYIIRLLSHNHTLTYICIHYIYIHTYAYIHIYNVYIHTYTCTGIALGYCPMIC